MGTVKKMSRAVCFIAALILAASVLMPYSAAQSVNETKRYLGEAVNAGHDTGYSQNQKLEMTILISVGNSVVFMLTVTLVLPKTKPETQSFLKRSEIPLPYGSN